MDDNLFLTCFWVVVVNTFLLTGLHIAFVQRLKGEGSIFLDTLGNPGSAYFLAGSWLGFGRYASALLTFKVCRSSEISASTKTIGAVASVLFYSLMLAWVVGICSLLVRQLAQPV